MDDGRRRASWIDRSTARDPELWVGVVERGAESASRWCFSLSAERVWV